MTERHGNYWNYEEESQLRIEYEELYMSVVDIARIHGRSTGTINSRIERLELARKKVFTLFVLKLEEERYFVGVTTSPTFTLSYDYDYGGGEWLREYGVVGFLEPPRRIDNLFEIDRRVKELMAEFGIERVRGGSYSSIQLTDEQVATLRLELKFVYNLRI